MSRLGFLSRSPALEREHDDFICHDEGSNTHCDGEGKHGHDIRTLHVENDVFGGRHEDKAAGDQAEGRDELGRRARGVHRGWRGDIHEHIGRDAGQGEADEQIAPLCVDHGRDHGALVVR